MKIPVHRKVSRDFGIVMFVGYKTTVQEKSRSLSGIAPDVIFFLSQRTSDRASQQGPTAILT